MSNDWFSDFSRLAKGSKARADAVNALFDLIVTGMDKMPTENQMNRGTRNYIASDTGIADSYAGSLSHVSSAYADGQEVDILIANANATTTPTLNVSTIGAVVIKKAGANPIPIGALPQNSIARFKYNDTLSHWELLGVYDITNTVSAFMATMLDDASASDARLTLGLSGARILLETQAASNDATIDFTSNIDGTYSRYLIEMINVVPDTDAATLRSRISVAGSWKSGASDYKNGTATTSSMQASASSMSNVDAEGGHNGVTTAYSPNDSAIYTIFNSESSSINSAGNGVNQGIAGAYLTAAAVDGFRFYFDSGDILSGTFKLYGVL